MKKLINTINKNDQVVNFHEDVPKTIEVEVDAKKRNLRRFETVG